MRTSNLLNYCTKLMMYEFIVFTNLQSRYFSKVSLFKQGCTRTVPTDKQTQPSAKIFRVNFKYSSYSQKKIQSFARMLELMIDPYLFLVTNRYRKNIGKT